MPIELDIEEISDYLWDHSNLGMRLNITDEVSVMEFEGGRYLLAIVEGFDHNTIDPSGISGASIHRVAWEDGVEVSDRIMVAKSVEAFCETVIELTTKGVN